MIAERHDAAAPAPAPIPAVHGDEQLGVGEQCQVGVEDAGLRFTGPLDRDPARLGGGGSRHGQGIRQPAPLLLWRAGRSRIDGVEIGEGEASGRADCDAG